MTSPPALTLAFLSHAPDSAAQVLEELEPAEAAAFIEQIPARMAVLTVGRMASWPAARCLEQMSPQRAAAVLRGLQFHDAVGLLRLIDGSLHAAIYEDLPSGRGRRLRNALQYPVGSIGAWLDPDVPSFASDATAADATKFLRQSAGASHVFLHDPENGQFVGAVAAINVMRRHSATRLDELPQLAVTPLSSRATLASAAQHDAWDDFLVLPVVGRARALVGGLSRAGARRGLADQRRTRQIASRSVLGQLIGAFGVSLHGLLRLLAPSASRKQEKS